MRCPGCGARNAPEADWCTQCHVRFDRIEVAWPQASATDRTGAGPEAQREVRDRNGVVEWRCATCGTWVVLDGAVCTSCGAPPAGMATGSPRRRQPAPAPRDVVRASLLLPGLGHLRAAQVGSGLARGILAVLWLAGGATILARSPTAPAGWLLVAGAAAVWVATAIDAHRLVAGDARQLLGTRGLFGLVLAVTGLLVAAVVLAPPVAAG